MEMFVFGGWKKNSNIIRRSLSFPIKESQANLTPLNS